MFISPLQPGQHAQTQLGASDRTKNIAVKDAGDFATISGAKESSAPKEITRAHEHKTDSRHAPSADDRIKKATVETSLDGTLREKVISSNTDGKETRISLDKTTTNEGIATSGTEKGTLTKALFDVSA